MSRAVVDEALLARFEARVAELLGLRPEPRHRQELERALARRARASGAASPQAYVATLGSSRAEVAALAAELTVGETFFFRHAEQFAALEEEVVPALVEDALRARRTTLRVLSAACATGEEAYTLALVLESALEAYTDGPRLELTAIDVDPAALARARAGRYERWSLRGAADPRLATALLPDGAGFRVASPLREAVAFEQRNLVDPDPAFWAPARFDLIWCRNALMYFTDPARRGVLARLSRALRPGGYLFLGHAESPRGVQARYGVRRRRGCVYYRLEPRSAVGAAPPAGPPAAAAPQAPPRARPDGGAPALAAALAWPGAAPLLPARPPERAAPAAEPRPAAAEAPQGPTPAAASAPAAGPAEADLLRVVALVRRGELAAAEATLAALLARDDLDPAARCLLGWCRELDDDLAAAAEAYRAAAYLDPAFALPRLHLGRLARRAGARDEARCALRAARELLPEDDPARLALLSGFGPLGLLELCEAELAALGRRR